MFKHINLTYLSTTSLIDVSCVLMRVKWLKWGTLVVNHMIEAALFHINK